MRLVVLFVLCQFTLGAQIEEAFRNQNYLEALELAETCIVDQPDKVSCLKVAAKSAFRLGDQAKAKLYLHQIEKADSTDTEAYSMLATIYEQQQNRAKAIKYYTLLNELLPGNPIYFRKNAALYLSYKDMPKAFSLFVTANELNPRDILTLKGLSELLFANGQYSDGDSLLNVALSIDSSHIGMRYLLAKSKYKQKQYDSVVPVLESLQHKVDLESYYNKLLGYSYLQIDSVDKAIVQLNKALYEDEENEHLHYYLASAFEKQDKTEAALEAYDNAIKYAISPQLDIYHRNIARLANGQKDYKKAISHYRDAYKYGEDDVMLYYLATTSDKYYKDKSIAIGYYGRYLKGNHDHEAYREYASKRRRYLKEERHLRK